MDFSTGLNVLTGETGAGKSIWVDAVGLALGNRADPNLIRQGEERCDITLCFDVGNIPGAQQWLSEQELESDGECIIRRILQRNGPSRSTINGHPCPLSLVRELGDLVLSIHGQHQHQTLLRRDAQQHCVDNYAHHQPQLLKTADYYKQWQNNALQLDKLTQQAGNRDAELELLRYQLNELITLAIKPNEWEELGKTHQRLHNSKDMMAQINEAIQLTVGDSTVNATQLLQQATNELKSIKAADPKITAITELLNTASINLQEAGDELNQYRDQLDLSPEHLQAIDDRLTAMHDLSRKHHCEPEQLPETEQSLQQQIESLENIDIKMAELEKQQQDILIQYKKIADALTKSRRSVAKTLSAAISKHIQTLGITGGRFQIDLEAIDEPISAQGNERIHFLVSTNPGQDLQSMQKIVSGGELSRISLALQVITAQKDNTPTLIFDEVDVGIGGKTADVVGDLLRQLGEQAQVLCITHLAQVASKGHHHYKVSKEVFQNTTNTQMTALDDKQRVDEIARMLGGSKITQQTLAHASELLEI